jgi:thiol-disulfide isomerase/thioredoxin/outer membrane lipoprotein-sorting protein
MKRPLFLGFFLSALILFACCTSPSGENDAAAKSELLAAFEEQSSEYSASYLLTISSPTQEHSQEMDYYLLGIDLVRIDSRTDSDVGTKESRVYILGNRSSLCNLNGSVWSCSSSDVEEGSANSYEASRQKMKDAITTANVIRLADRTVAGVDARCYNLSGYTSGMVWSYVYCISEGGVPLYVVAESAGVSIKQEATRYSSNVSSSDYVLPSEQMDPIDVIVPYEAGVNRTFQDTGDVVCKEDGKPVIRMFSTTWCPHCKWIKETYDETVKKYVDEGKIIARHWEFDTLDDTLTPEAENAVPDSEKALFDKYNPSGGVPTYVFGCKYVRVGNGYESGNGLAAEKKEFEDLIRELSSCPQCV